MYYYGVGTSEDIKKAAYWYEKAAEHGHPKAQYSLGVMYLYEKGIKDREKGIYWLEKSAESGNEYAIEELKEIARK